MNASDRRSSPRRRRRTGAIAALALAFVVTSAVSACAPGGASSADIAGNDAGNIAGNAAGGRRTPVVVVTDLGPDDVVSLVALARSPRVELRGVSLAASGAAPCQEGLQVLRGVLVQFGYESLAVACTPRLAGQHPFPSAWRAAATTGYGLELPWRNDARHDIDAADIVGDQLRDGDERATLLALAPLPDVAALLEVGRASLGAHLRRIVLSGGALDQPGDATPAAEWNFYADAAAAAAVLGSRVPITVVPLDATTTAPSLGDVAAALQGRDSQAELLAAAAASAGVEAGLTRVADLVATAAVLEPGTVAVHPDRVRVVTEGADEGRLVRDDAGAEVQVATVAVPGRVLAALTDALAAPPPPPPSAPPIGEGRVQFDGTSCRYQGAARLVNGGRLRLHVVDTSGQGLVGIAARVTIYHDPAEVDAWVATASGPGLPPMVDRLDRIAVTGPTATVADVEVTPGITMVGCYEPATGRWHAAAYVITI